MNLTFNLALARRWDSFDDDRRDIIRYQEVLQNSDFKYAGLDPDLENLYPNYWHHTDYAHYKVLGPVVISINVMESWLTQEEILITSGTEWIELSRTYWPPDPTTSTEEFENFGERPIHGSDNVGWPLPGHVVIGQER